MRRIAVFAVLLVGCAPPDEEVQPLPWALEETEAAITATTCPPQDEVCSGTSDVYSSLYRVGRSSTQELQVAQTFTVPVGGVPDLLRVKLRLLRPLSLGENPQLGVRVVEAPGGVVPPSAADLATGQTAVATLSRGLPEEVSIALGGTTSLVPGTTYAFILTVDAPTTGEALVGIASHKTSSYAGGAASLRRPAGTGFTTTHGGDLSFALGVQPPALAWLFNGTPPTLTFCGAGWVCGIYGPSLWSNGESLRTINASSGGTLSFTFTTPTAVTVREVLASGWNNVYGCSDLRNYTLEAMVAGNWVAILTATSANVHDSVVSIPSPVSASAYRATTTSTGYCAGQSALALAFHVDA